MAMNTAEQLDDYYDNTVLQANPEPVKQPGQTVAPAPVSEPSKISVSKFEIVVAVSCVIITLFMAISLVTTKNQVTSAQHQHQNINSQITKVNSQNDSNKQVIDELTGSTHLQQVAQKSGLSINSDIRNVNK